MVSAACTAPATPVARGGGGAEGTEGAETPPLDEPPPLPPLVVALVMERLAAAWAAGAVAAWACAAWAAATLALNAAVAAAWAGAAWAACCCSTSAWMLALTLLRVPWYWLARAEAWFSALDRLSSVEVCCACCCSRELCAAWSCACAVWRWSTVVVTLPVAIAEYSERTPLVLTFDVNIWVTWLLVPLLV